MKVAIVVGHDENEQGAFSWWLDKSEYPFNKEFADQINADVLYRKPRVKGFGYVSQMKELGKRTKDYDVVAELHFNASEGGIANGCEALYWVTNEKGKRYSNKFLEILTQEMPELRNRGVKAIYSRKQRGFHFHAQTKGTSIILEPFFGDSEKDRQRFRVVDYVCVLNKWIEFIKSNQ